MKELFHKFQSRFYTNGIPNLKWTMFPTKTSFHGIVYFV